MIAIAGGHGKIALLLTRRLSARGETVVGLIRTPDQADDVRAAGGEPRVCDLEHADVSEVTAAVAGAAAVVFAAGAGPGSSPERKWTVDRDGAEKLREAAVAAAVPRYLIISSVGAEDPPDGDDVFSVYLQAKAQADAAVQASDRDWTIVRPGRLTDAPGTERVRIDLEPFRGEVPRADVAAVLDGLLARSILVNRILYVNAGETPVTEALQTIG
jgi:nucleoside-diphosphate-sugar epimerase